MRYSVKMNEKDAVRNICPRVDNLSKQMLDCLSIPGTPLFFNPKCNDQHDAPIAPPSCGRELENRLFLFPPEYVDLHIQIYRDRSSHSHVLRRM